MTEKGATSTAVRRSLDLLFRRRAGQLAATLVRVLGLHSLELIDDVVQEAFVQALRKWPYTGIPDSPGAWVLRVVKNRAVDVLRRQGRWREKRAELERSILPATEAGRAFFSAELGDDQLRLMFACCHPMLSRDAQVALTLKTVGGFGVAEIARAFLTRRSTIAQRLVRARHTLRRRRVELAIPSGDELPPRLAAVLEVLYLMFTEGHAATTGDALVRADLCREAIRLAELIAAHPVVGGPPVNALTALFLFQAARLPARSDEGGELALLGEQDRSRWDRRLQRRALEHLRLAGRGDALTRYHLEAEIASCHALAESFEATDWPRILECYDRLLALAPSPVVALNRVVALAEVRGPKAGLAALDALIGDPALGHYGPRFAIEGELLERLGRDDEAHAALIRAAELTTSEPVRRHLLRRARREHSPVPIESETACSG